MKKLSLAYFGTPYFSALFLEKLLNDKKLPIEMKFVLTQPDKPVGRRQIMTESPVKAVAKKYGIPVFNPSLKSQIGNWKLEIGNLDLAFLYAYGNILPNEIINLPKFGFWNTHPSLLPKYRGAAPIAMPLILGDKKTGVTLIRLDEEIDHGPVITQEELEIRPTDKRSDLEIKLTNLAFEMFKKILSAKNADSQHMSRVAANNNNGTTLTSLMHVQEDAFEPRIKFTHQNHAAATQTRLLTKDDGFIPFEILKDAMSGNPSITQFQPKIIEDYYDKNSLVKRSKVYNPSFAKASEGKLKSTIYNLFRGLYPWPGIWTIVQPARLPSGHGKRLKITELDLVDDKLIINKVQLEGKKEVDFETFERAYGVFENQS